MRKNPLFSTYRQGENRVTSSMVAVFERIDLSLVEEILASATGESSLQMVSFVNQPGGETGTVPDARISGAFSYWFEVKTQPNALTREQLEGHLAHLTDAEIEERLIVVTPDPVEPDVVGAVDDPRLLWLNFRSISDAIHGVLEDRIELVSEQARFLLNELRALLAEERLIESTDVVVVAARVAYGEYLRHAAYVCQPHRSFRAGLTHMGFYVKGEIRPEIPHILADEDEVVFSKSEARLRKTSTDPLQSRIGHVIEELLGSSTRSEGQSYRVFILSGPDADETVHLSAPIKNTSVDKSGKPWAWTLSQRYTSLVALTAPGVATTDQLSAGVSASD